MISTFSRPCPRPLTKNWPKTLLIKEENPRLLRPIKFFFFLKLVHQSTLDDIGANIYPHQQFNNKILSQLMTRYY